MSALDDRRQAAYEAGYDAIESGGQMPAGAVLDSAIETATRVRITPEIIGRAGSVANDLIFHPPNVPMPDGNERWRIILAAAFAAAGFEVGE